MRLRALFIRVALAALSILVIAVVGVSSVIAWPGLDSPPDYRIKCDPPRDVRGPMPETNEMIVHPEDDDLDGRKANLWAQVIVANPKTVKFLDGLAASRRLVLVGVNDETKQAPLLRVPARNMYVSESESLQFSANLDGTPSMFPFDRYRITLEAFVGINPTAVSPVSVNSYWIHHYRNWNVTDVCQSVSEDQSESRIDYLSVRRPYSFTLYVLALATLPLLIGGAFLYRRLIINAGEENTSPLELGSALLAFLTVRQVLVPGTITDVTLLDRFVGVELTIIVCLTVAGYLYPPGKESDARRRGWREPTR